jgi:hypothetical protein
LCFWILEPNSSLFCWEFWNPCSAHSDPNLECIGLGSSVVPSSPGRHRRPGGRVFSLSGKSLPSPRSRGPAPTFHGFKADPLSLSSKTSRMDPGHSTALTPSVRYPCSPQILLFSFLAHQPVYNLKSILYPQIYNWRNAFKRNILLV